MVKKCPGSKIRSKGKGKGLGTGREKGPIGNPSKRQNSTAILNKRRKANDTKRGK